MDVEDAHSRIKSKLNPPKEASLSLILNGIGNGMMVGAVPFVLMETYSHIAGVALSRKLYMANAAATLGGCALGAWYGQHEATKLDEYRNSVADEFIQLNDKLGMLNAKQDKWTARIEKEAVARSESDEISTRS